MSLISLIHLVGKIDACCNTSMIRTIVRKSAVRSYPQGCRRYPAEDWLVLVRCDCGSFSARQVGCGARPVHGVVYVRVFP